ncbi:MAG: pantoate--beta-alanine ligase [Micrococcales bacterium]
MLLVHTASELAEALAPARAAGQKIGFVPTMGALHAGHISLVDLATSYSDVVVVSIFVNPKQFGAGEDFDRYPRTLDADCALLEGRADIVFAPVVEDVYPADQPVTERHAGPVGELFEGASRPGHFDGMLTVVGRLFELVQPDIAVFGQKDAQQVFLVEAMVEESFPHLRIIVGDTVREASGLAMSSRNRYLNGEQTDIAEILAITLATVDRLIQDGMEPETALGIGEELIAGEPETKLDYLALVDPRTFTRVGNGYTGEALLLVAARVGGIRLIDNHRFDI